MRNIAVHVIVAVATVVGTVVIVVVGGNASGE